MRYIKHGLMERMEPHHKLDELTIFFYSMSSTNFHFLCWTLCTVILLIVQEKQDPHRLLNPTVAITAIETKAAIDNLFTDTDAAAFELLFWWLWWKKLLTTKSSFSLLLNNIVSQRKEMAIDEGGVLTWRWSFDQEKGGALTWRWRWSFADSRTPRGRLQHWLVLTFSPHTAGSSMAVLTLMPSCLTLSRLRRLRRHDVLKLFGIRPIYFRELFSLHSTDCFHPSLKDHVGSLVSTFGHNIIGTEVFFTSSELLKKIIWMVK